MKPIGSVKDVTIGGVGGVRNEMQTCEAPAVTVSVLGFPQNSHTLQKINYDQLLQPCINHIARLTFHCIIFHKPCCENVKNVEGNHCLSEHLKPRLV